MPRRKPAPPIRPKAAAARVAAAGRSVPSWIGASGPWLAVALAAFVYRHALATFFSGDDVVFLARVRGLAPLNWSIARPLSGPLRWSVSNALFGLHPLPYHVVGLAFHLVNVVLVHRVARRLGLGAGAATAAAILFGVSAIAFTPLHWVSGGGELMVTAFALVAFEACLAAAAWRPGLVLCAVALLLALLCKETALLLPVVFAAALWARRREPVANAGSPAQAIGHGALRDRFAPALVAAAVSLAFGIAFFASQNRVEFLGGEAYAMSAATGVWLGNLATYLAWLVSFRDPIPDAAAMIHPDAWRVALPLVVLLAAAVSIARGGKKPWLVAGALWFLLLLAPLLPLLHHTYLYYLYLPWAGACWLLGGVGEGLAARWRPIGWVAAAAVLALVGGETVRVRARETELLGTFAADRTMRESTLLRNVVATLDTLNVPAGSRIAYVNPAPRQGTALVDTTGHEHFEYVPLEAALQGGLAIRVFHPGFAYAGFFTDLPDSLADAEALLYRHDGSARWIGHGSTALAELGYFRLRFHEWAEADTLFTRSLARGDTLPDALFGRMTIASVRGDQGGAIANAREFLRRWPREERASVVAQALKDAEAGGQVAPTR